MTIKRVLEVCAFNIQSCLVAEKAGAVRVELCDNPVEGGTTPSYGTIRQAREKINILLYPIIRPRSGNYYYNDDEYAIIRHDIAISRELGCNGISVGAQNIDATINKDMMKRIVEWAGPMGVTCNRAFDGTPDPFQALEDIIEAGCERVLTSGQASAAPDAADLLGKLVQQAAGRIIIMPGAGVKSGNIRQLATVSGATEFHSSARAVAPNPQSFINKRVTDYGSVYISEESEVRKMIENISF
ncbi:MAG: copper homeostasis protein CutC [Sphingobacteriales bacterium]|nr:MAG: copper homeostasis protein CutC [Sphingobacteriales bacterium]